MQRSIVKLASSDDNVTFSKSNRFIKDSLTQIILVGLNKDSVFNLQLYKLLHLYDYQANNAYSNE